MVRVWDTASGRVDAEFRGGYRALRALAFSDDGRFLAVGGDEKVIEVFSVGDWTWSRLIATPGPRVLSVAFWYRENRALVAVLSDGSAFALDERGKVSQHEDDGRGHPVASVYAAASMTGGYEFEMDVAVGEEGGRIRIDRMDDAGGRRKDIRRIPRAHDGPVTALVRIPHSEVLLSAGVDGAIRSWDLHSLDRISEILVEDNPVHALVLSKDGTILWAARSDGTVLGYDLKALLPATMGK
jgi:WD40 repeat protein